MLFSSYWLLMESYAVAQDVVTIHEQLESRRAWWNQHGPIAWVGPSHPIPAILR